MGIKPFGSWVSKPFGSWVSKPFGSWVSKPFGSNPLVHGSQKISQKKEDIKMDDQKKIKILKYFDHGLQNKNKKSMGL